MSSPAYRQRKKTQTGAVLVVSLLFLVLMMLIGLTGMQVTSLEEKMSGNMRDRNLAFQAAESALRAGEIYLQTTPVLPGFVCANGLYPYNDIDCDNVHNDQIWNTSSVWSGSSSKVDYSGYSSLASLASGSAPAYIIEEMPPPDIVMLGVPVTSQYYRVTARATGGTSDAVVLLQSLYKR